jgi:D-alanyl-D-alanine carboxypeptidase
MDTVRAALDDPMADLAARHLDDLVARHRADGRMPGLAVAATDGDGVLLEAYHGWADVAARRPVDASTVFQIGSITKVATAVLAVQQWEAGRLDPHAPVREYLPWLPAEPYGWITSHHLLSHTAGLAAGSDVSPPSPYMALSACFPPPARDAGFSYSNAGPQVMGLVIEAVAGRPYAELVAGGILAPLGMAASFPVIDSAARPSLAVGYFISPDDRPFAAGDGLAPAPFFDYAAGDGSMACTATDLAAFARMLINKGGGVLTPAGFELLTAPVADTGDGEFVCYGIFAGEKYGYPDLNHGGNMVGFDSMLCVDRESGLGVVTLTNGVADSTPVARGLLRMLRDAHRGVRPSLPPQPADPPLSDYEGRYRGRGAERVVRDEGGRLLLDGAELTRIRGDLFAVSGSPYAVRFGREDGQKGPVVELCHGPGHWVTGAYTGEVDRPHPPEWDAYCGQYRAHKPFEPTFRVLIRNGALLQAWPFGRERTLVPTGEPATFRVDDTVEVLTFDTPAGDHMLRAVLSGCPHYRTLDSQPAPRR